VGRGAARAEGGEEVKARTVDIPASPDWMVYGSKENTAYVRRLIEREKEARRIIRYCQKRTLFPAGRPYRDWQRRMTKWLKG
jgi:hypothetical protein